MLSIETKRKIDHARDVLVGKIPNPQAQVEQITTALIYKFMDDMDEKAKSLGGKSRFFVGEYEKYSWRTLLDPRIGGQERMNLYSEAVTKLSQNPALPQIFRDVFKDAFVPYRDPETLSLFLKEINWFDYHHSEELGNAYEYLLSIMGSQGDAGQFRTPRHVIDFIVEAVDPQKDETVLDPACGTAGFLISAYKHILKSNDGIDDVTGLPNPSESRLTPEERAKLLDNFKGYDISPEMIRLSLVNMYLHGFVKPNIEEYDSLTYEDHWNDDYDVILANPPFMTPKGGVRPHKKFQIQANRAEVLFVDYIAEHLKSKGRAGIVVPEGIIFQGGTAYKSLRKMLIEEQGLWAVVSLPTGVFQPYSGVKTSILLLDKERAKSTDDILFIDVKNDGYSLGAQRTPIKLNDFPEALNIIKMWKLGEKVDTKIAHWVNKSVISANGDYGLSGSRYLSATSNTSTDWPMIELGDLLEYEQPTKYIVRNTEYKEEFKIPVLTAGKTFILGYTNETDGIYSRPLPVIIFDDFTTATKLVDFPFKVKSSAMKILKTKDDNVDIRFVYYLMQRLHFKPVEHKRFWISEYSKLKIPCPPLEKQIKIADEIESYQKIIDGARQVVDNWKPSLPINPKWEIKSLPEVVEINKSTAEPSKIFGNDADFTYIDVSSVGNGNGVINFSNIIKSQNAPSRARRIVKNGDILLSTVRPNLKAFALIRKLPERVLASTGFAVLTAKKEFLIPEYLYYAVMSEGYVNQLVAKMGKGSYPSVNTQDIAQTSIFLPSLEEQKDIAKLIEAEFFAVENCKKLVKIYQEKINAKAAEVWGV